ncbi:hypothetical protein TNCV_4517821 [Trichonephila clavipes]|nr:hypothetical protein TNCV_4517821 [Trichonephila clavipes]
MPQQLSDTSFSAWADAVETCLAVREIISPTKDRMFLAGHHHQGMFSAFSRIALHAFFNQASFYPLISLLLIFIGPVACIKQSEGSLNILPSSVRAHLDDFANEAAFTNSFEECPIKSPNHRRLFLLNEADSEHPATPLGVNLRNILFLRNPFLADLFETKETF